MVDDVEESTEEDGVEESIEEVDSTEVETEEESADTVGVALAVLPGANADVDDIEELSNDELNVENGVEDTYDVEEGAIDVEVLVDASVENTTDEVGVNEPSVIDCVVEPSIEDSVDELTFV